MDFQYLFPQKIIFKTGASSNLGEILKNKINDVLIITGGNSLRKSGNYDKIINSLKKQNINFIEYSGINGEPTPEIIDKTVIYATQNKIKSIIAIGGGSVIDTGKAVAALAVNNQGVENYLEGVGKNFKVENDPLPFIAIPTTAGSGAEATKNAVVTSREKKYKKSFRDDRLIAKIIIVDPLLTLTLPKDQTAFCGMDAICQLMESYVSKKSNIYSKAFSAFFIPKALDAVIKAYNDQNDIEARSIMSTASLASGLALANSGLGAVHGFASGLGGMFDIPHGLICAVLLPAVCKINAEKIPDAYKELASLINPDGSNDINKMIDYLYMINEKLYIPNDFKKFSILLNQANEIVARSKGSSMNGNPIELTDEEWTDFIKKYI